MQKEHVFTGWVSEVGSQLRALLAARAHETGRHRGVPAPRQIAAAVSAAFPAAASAREDLA